MMAKIDVELKKLHQILVDRDYFYQVPDYQRPYVWDKDHLGALIDDLVGSYTNNREDEYFCGSIVIVENQKDKRWDVVDGQQRLTSFIILACTILRLYKHSLGQESKDFIEDSIYDRYDKEKERLKFLTAQNYNSIFENTVLNHLEFEDNIKKSELNKKFEENTYLRNAYYFKELLNESVENGSISDIDDFVKWFYEHIVLTRIICFEQDSAMQIFQVLNDRGQPLSPIDILKSSLMQEIKQDSEKRKDFITTWDKLVEACKSVEGVDIDLEDFFNMYLEYADPSTSKKRADKGLKKVFKDSKKDACGFIYEISEFMKAYTALLKKQDRYVYLLRYLPSRYWASILTTALYVKYPDFDALKKLLVSYYYQTWIAGGTITRIKQTSINIIKNVKSNKSVETIKELILNSIDSYNTFDQYLYNLWDSSSVYHSKWVRPVLALANYFMADEEKPHFIAMDAETQVEHILPQTPKRGSQWNADFDKEKREEWVNNIANLTLLKRKKNAHALNGDFDEKRKIYGGKDTSKVISCYDITKELYSNYRKWNEKSLQERYKSLYNTITPVLHIEGQEDDFEDDFDLE
ncbi:DUF262 domain-containing protein [Helicobacter pylori]|jgi:Uncharacterized conserved protein|uniref:DUF262 domain-containing protein n=5 Tax=Helicobacter pylori TaxID=210 RepID=O34810_HELPY|nr:predicted coding region HP0426 [Helicobacter pylori 26695]AUV74638.1 DUF262 domain-containing protein [Helicobacter pylori]AAD08452.1 predicted coding region HP1409 [Helicobacter pylori 26695]AUV75537.1 DUF262 domain-containing protein [Helicobacter pylori]AUV76136.1 DUF262 domain-containing protein [Helicobacter pylori]